MGVRVGVAHHLGWAVLVSATDDFEVADRRRVELVGHGLPAAPVHHRGGIHELHAAEYLDDAALEALVADVAESARQVTAAALDDLVTDVGVRIESISLRDWPVDFPADIARRRKPPFESRADSVMYRKVIAELASDRGWTVHRFHAATIEADAAAILGDRARAVLHGPGAVLGPPWNKDHRIALSATIVAARTRAVGS